MSGEVSQLVSARTRACVCLYIYTWVDGCALVYVCVCASVLCKAYCILRCLIYRDVCSFVSTPCFPDLLRRQIPASKDRQLVLYLKTSDTSVKGLRQLVLYLSRITTARHRGSAETLFYITQSCRCCWCCLVTSPPSDVLVYLRHGSALTDVRAATLRLKLPSNLLSHPVTEY